MLMDRADYDNGILEIIRDTHKFKLLTDDPTKKREQSLQRTLRNLKTKIFLLVYYPRGSQPAEFTAILKYIRSKIRIFILLLDLLYHL